MISCTRLHGATTQKTAIFWVIVDWMCNLDGGKENHKWYIILEYKYLKMQL
jgi:hypothetical protein